MSADERTVEHAARPKPTRGTSLLESALRHDRVVALLALAAVAALAWAYTLAGVGMGMSAFDMTAMLQADPDMAMPPTRWSPLYGALVFLMWWIMMIAMMVPSAAPMVLLFAVLSRRTGAAARRRTAAFVAGYLLVWALFSAAAAVLHWALDAAGVIGPMMATTSPIASGFLLLGAGLYQLTPVKQACLRQCRDPIRFVTAHWRPGAAGALRMGAVHGVYCLGCCWVLMALLFVGGVMNVYWIAGIATYVLVEKLVRRGRWLTNAAGAALMVAGAVVLANAL